MNGTKMQGVAIGEADERRLAVLCLLDEADDPGVGALGGRRGGAKVERGPGVDGARGDLVALLAGHQAGLAGERGFVEDGRTPDDHPVDRHHFAGADRQQVTGDDGLDRGRLEPAIEISLDVPRCPSEQRGQFAVRAALRVALQRLAGREHDGDDRRRRTARRAAAPRRWPGSR